MIHGHIGGVFNYQTLNITDHCKTRVRQMKFNIVVEMFKY